VTVHVKDHHGEEVGRGSRRSLICQPIEGGVERGQRAVEHQRIGVIAGERRQAGGIAGAQLAGKVLDVNGLAGAAGVGVGDGDGIAVGRGESRGARAGLGGVRAVDGCREIPWSDRQGHAAAAGQGAAGAGIAVVVDQDAQVGGPLKQFGRQIN
jgi:hypothetical protein